MGEETYHPDGLYVGAGAGLATVFLKNTVTNNFNTFNVGTTNVSNDSKGGILFEGQVGYGKMYRENTYLGVKGSVYYTPINYRASNTSLVLGQNSGAFIDNDAQARFDPVFNIDGVLGFELFQHFLPFVQAGVSFAGLNATDVQRNVVLNLSTAGSVAYSTASRISSYKTGYNVGLGGTYQMTPSWLFSTELVYNYLGKFSAGRSVESGSNLGTFTMNTNKKLNQVSWFGTISYLIPGT